MKPEENIEFALGLLMGSDHHGEPCRCATCYHYQTVYERNRPTDRRACFGEHLRVSVCGLDWEDEAEAWAEMEPTDFCSKWETRD